MFKLNSLLVLAVVAIAASWWSGPAMVTLVPNGVLDQGLAPNGINGQGLAPNGIQSQGLALPPVSDQHFPVLFAPGLPKLYRVPTQDEEAIWNKLVRPIQARVLSRDRHSRQAIEALFSIAAAELTEGSLEAADTL